MSDPPRRREGYTVDVVPPDDLIERRRPLEALWFELAEAWGDEEVGPIAIVAVPDLDSLDVVEYAHRLAEVGATISGRDIRLMVALDVRPSDSRVVEELDDHDGLMTLLVVHSPTADPAAIPLLRRCESIVPVVQLGTTLEDEVEQLVDAVGQMRVPTLLCIDREPHRSRFRRTEQSVVQEPDELEVVP